jgi:hypothetical protein
VFWLCPQDGSPEQTAERRVRVPSARRGHCVRGGRGLALVATNQWEETSAYIFKGWATHPMSCSPHRDEVRPEPLCLHLGPLSSSQDGLFAEDIQMYKEQIRPTPSPLTSRKKAAERAQSDIKQAFFFWVLNVCGGGAGGEGQGMKSELCVFKVLIHNLFP